MNCISHLLFILRNYVDDIGEMYMLFSLDALLVITGDSKFPVTKINIYETSFSAHENMHQFR